MKYNKRIFNQMLDYMKKIPAIYYPSQLWQELNKRHIYQISDSGINNFKRTLNNRYFYWGTLAIIAHRLSPVVDGLKEGNLTPFFDSSFKNYNLESDKGIANINFMNTIINKIHSIITFYDSSNIKKYNLESDGGIIRFNFISAFIFKIYSAYLYDYVKKHDTFKILDVISEPKIGNPILVRYKGKFISQDLCNSVFEFYSTAKQIDFNNKSKISIAEIGAGYGRLAHVFLKMLPNATYCIIDIPPALYISQEYLSRLFPKEKIFRFRPFNSYSEIKKEFESARIKFLMANQIELLPKKSLDLIIHICSLQEMSFDQIYNYLKQSNRLSHGYVYIKQWKRSNARDNSYIKEEEYPIPKRWKTVYNRYHPIQKLFFEALYRVA